MSPQRDSMIEAIKAAVKGRDLRGVDSRCCHPGGRQSPSLPSVAARDDCLRDSAISSRRRTRRLDARAGHRWHNAPSAWQLSQPNQHGPSPVFRDRFQTSRSQSRHRSRRTPRPRLELGRRRCTLHNVRPTAVGRLPDSTRSDLRIVYSLRSHITGEWGGDSAISRRNPVFSKSRVSRSVMFPSEELFERECGRSRVLGGVLNRENVYDVVRFEREIPH